MDAPINRQGPYDIIVAGAGIGGLCAALRAQEKGASVAVLENAQGIGELQQIEEMKKSKNLKILEILERLKELKELNRVGGVGWVGPPPPGQAGQNENLGARCHRNTVVRASKAKQILPKLSFEAIWYSL